MDTQTQPAEGVFDGELLNRRLRRWAERMDTALTGISAAMPNHTIESISVALTVDAALNIGFAGVGGELGRHRTFEFQIKPK